MANKIIITLDPGHGKDYNRGVIKTYYESNAVYEAYLMLKKYLDRYKIFDVKTTKPVLDCCPSLAERGSMAIQNNSRMFISLHTNAASESVAYTVTFSSVKRKQTSAFTSKVNSAITAIMRKYSGVGNDNGVLHKATSSGTDYYGVLRNAVLQDCIQYVFLIEHAFHTNTPSCQALLSVECWDEMMKKLAEMIYEETKKYYIGDNVATYTGTTTAALNIRSDPSVDAVKLGIFSNGASIKIVSKLDGWYKILYHGCAAYVSSEYVKAPSTIPEDCAVDFQLPDTDESGEDVTPPTSEKEFLAQYGIDIDHIPDEDDVGKVNTSAGLNVRSGPDVSYAKTDALAQGTLVGIYEVNPLYAIKDIGNWYYINYVASDKTTKHGFVSRDYIDRIIDTTPIGEVNEPSGLNYRTGPGTGYPKAGVLVYGTRVYMLGSASEDPSWEKIRLLDTTDKMVYYVSSKYLTEVAVDLPTNPDDLPNQKYFIKSIADCSYATAIASGIAIRSVPDSRGTKIGSTTKDEIYVVTETLSVSSKAWAKVVCGANYGYIDMDYLNILVPAQQINEVETPQEIAELVEQIPELSVKEWFMQTLGATITSDYGERIHPITNVTSFHYGIDFGAAANTPIYTMIDGIVIVNTYDTSYGNYLVILDEMGRRHYFAHMKCKGVVEVGTFVSAGQMIGNVGTTGDSTGNHLHYEVRLAPWDRTSTIDPNSIAFQ